MRTCPSPFSLHEAFHFHGSRAMVLQVICFATGHSHDMRSPTPPLSLSPVVPLPPRRTTRATRRSFALSTCKSCSAFDRAECGRRDERTVCCEAKDTHLRVSFRQNLLPESCREEEASHVVLWTKIPRFLRDLGHFAIQLCLLRDTIRAPDCSEEMRHELLARVALQFNLT
jgi:hypothetical protein